MKNHPVLESDFFQINIILGRELYLLRCGIHFLIMGVMIAVFRRACKSEFVVDVVKRLNITLKDKTPDIRSVESESMINKNKEFTVFRSSFPPALSQENIF